MANVAFGGNVTNYVYIGGAVGAISSTSQLSAVRNCVNYGTVTHSGTSGSWSYLGGIAGYAYGRSASYNSYVQNCLNYGTITHSGTSVILVIGGVTGYNVYSFVDNCVNSGLISTNQGSKYIGAVVGYISDYTEITHCYWADNIEYYPTAGYVASAALLSDNSAFSVTSFELNEAVVIGTSTTTSLISALDAAADHYTLREYSRWLLNKDSRSVSFTVDNAKLSVTLTSQIILLPSLAGRGSTVFRGWYTDSSCTSLFADYDYSEESDLSLYGRVEKDSSSYTITFDTRGGTSVSPITGQFESVVTLPTDSTKEHCKIFEWETEYGDVVSNEFTIPAQNVTLYAVWACTHITTASDFISFSKAVNSGETYSGTTVFLDADIDFDGYSSQFISIGYFRSRYFLGTFDGQGHTISNLVISSSMQYTGLFGYSEGTTIQDVVIDDTCSFTGSYVPDEYVIGNIIGTCYSIYGPCTISNSVNMASVTFEGNTTGIAYIGGIAGFICSFYYPSTIINCVNYGSVTHSGVGGSSVIIGGIIAYAYGISSNIYVQNCANYGSIAHSGTSGTPNIGGVVGISMYSFIGNCVSSGVISTNLVSNHIGTIVGSISEYYTEITHCYWTNDVGNFSVYGFNGLGLMVANLSLASLNQTTLEGLNEYASKNETWSKWLMVHLNGGRINNITQESLVEIQGHFPDPVKEENTFLSWCKDVECNEVFDPKKDSVNEITDIYAAWTVNKYTVTFDFGNGTVVNANFSYNTSIMYPKNLKKEGYTFNGWDSYIDFMPARDITITALWTEAVVSKSVEIVFDTKDLSTKDEEELKEEVKEIIKTYTNEEFTIEGFVRNSETGEIRVIIKFVDEAKAEDFVRTVNENKRSNSMIKRISIVSDEDFSSRIAIFSFFFSLLFFV